MPTLRIRVVGVSHAIEGIGASGIDGEALFDALQARHGQAVAGVGVPLEAVVVDQKADSWEGMKAWLELWLEAEGFTIVAWSNDEDPDAEGPEATVHFHP